MRVVNKAVHAMKRSLGRRTARRNVVLVLMVFIMLIYLEYSPHTPPLSSPYSSNASSLISFLHSASFSVSSRLAVTFIPPSGRIMSGNQSVDQVVATGTKASCQPRHDLLFFKTHKCASSTTQRIFLRYGKEHGLSQALPVSGNYLGSPALFNPSMLPPTLRTPDDKYNMMVVHTRLDADAMTKVMREGAAWVTTVREPLALFQSLWGFFWMEKYYKMSLEMFANLPYERVARWRKNRRFGIHQMFFDFGYSTAESISPERMNHILETLNSTFDLVMVAERYDESLVLLKDMMCWTADDVAYVRINIGKNKNKTKLSEEAREKLLRLSYPDVEIYKFFVRVFEAKIEAFGHARMEKELATLRAANKRLEEMCLVQNYSPLKLKKDMGWAGPVGRVSVRGDIQKCVDLARTEHSMLDELREKQKVWVAQGWREPLSQVKVPPS